MVLELLKSGVSPNIGDAKNWTPLHIAAARNYTHLIEPLVVTGADIEAKTTNELGRFEFYPSSTALHCTIECDAVDAARGLLRFGANINARDAHGQTPLRLAVETSGTCSLVSSKLARLFIEAGADINAYDNWGYTIFHEASNAIHLAPGYQ